MESERRKTYAQPKGIHKNNVLRSCMERIEKSVRYLKGTVDDKLHYNRTKTYEVLKGYVDADFPREPIDRCFQFLDVLYLGTLRNKH